MARKKNNGKVCKLYRKDENGNWVEIGGIEDGSITVPEYNPTDEEIESFYKKESTIIFKGSFRAPTDQELLAIGKILNGNTEGELN